jgi:hypothetical protein
MAINDPTLRAVLDEIIPPAADGSFPGAGLPSVAERVQQAIAEDSELAAEFGTGFAALAELVSADGSETFPEMPPTARTEAITKLSEQAPDFFAKLLSCTALAYYQEPSVVTALGMEARPPFPEGYEVKPWDASLLEPVLTRPPFHR